VAERKSLDPAKMMEIRMGIEDGSIPLGPLAFHAPITEDTRDMRDPSLIGLALADLHIGAASMCERADIVETMQVGTYDKSESMQTIAQAEVETDYKRRAEQGDRFAQIALSGEAWDEPVDG
jgi:hypothetical protein